MCLLAVQHPQTMPFRSVCLARLGDVLYRDVCRIIKTVVCETLPCAWNGCSYYHHHSLTPFVFQSSLLQAKEDVTRQLQALLGPAFYAQNAECLESLLRCERDHDF